MNMIEQRPVTISVSSIEIAQAIASAAAKPKYKPEYPGA